MENLVPDGELKDEIGTLLKRKLSGEELEMEPQIQRLNVFLNEEITRLREFANTLKTSTPESTPELDLLFRNTLDEVWS